MTGRKFVLEVIEMYRKSPCLWKTTHHHYHNKNKRNAALDELLELFQKVDPSANKDTVQKKISSLRSAFKKELNKVKTSMRSGVAPDEIHVPKLWYYQYMLFLEDVETPKRSKNSRFALDDMPLEEIEEIYTDDVSSPQSQESTSSSKRSQSIKENSFERTKATADLVLNKISTKLDTIDLAKQLRENQDVSVAFGQYVASEVRNLPENMKKICKKLINDAIFQASMGQLNFTSRVATDPTSTGNDGTMPN